MFQKGSGVRLERTRIKPAIERRIEWLGRMNDRHLALVANKDAAGLLMLASEYEKRNMLATAKGIRLVVSRMATEAK